MGFEDSFLSEHDPRTWHAPADASARIAPSVFFLGNGDHALEVALASARTRPKADDVRKLWHARQGRRPSPLLLIVGYPEHGETRVALCGAVGDQPPLAYGLEVSQVERLAAAALSEPSRHSAIRFLVAMIPEVGADMPGMRNSGLLATQELRNGVPARSDWAGACERSGPLLSLRGRELVEGLGFGIEQLSVASSVLTVKGGAKRAVAVFLDEGETFDDPATRLGSSPVSHALALADRESVPWVVLTRARQIRLYAARPDTGVGRKGRAETFVEIDLALLPAERAGYLDLLFSSSALMDDGTLEEVLSRSADFAAELAVRLRDRVYFEAVPGLATAVASRIDRTIALDDDALAAAYEQTLVILFRLLFLAYAEDKDLLPYRSNSRYADHALKTIARRLAEDRSAGKAAFDDGAIDLWEDVRQLWRAVDHGNTGWGVPGYNGGLFSDDPKVNASGAALAGIQLTDAELGPALMALLVDEGADAVIGPVDFRSLSVREFGTIYEGLLESMLSIAPADLAVDAKGSYVPTKKKKDAVVESGEIYFHNRSGARKATGSYFTKPFAVEHLLDHALEPALTDHLDRLQQLLDAGDEAGAAAAFFDFRCVDLAMGSGHFLVAAVDRIEARLSGFLALHPIGPVAAELEQLRQAALGALGDLADGVEIETTSLLRRQVARRCVYGVDLNHISVELARLAIWIHTFVPGLPLSFLDHNLVCGNSLTGIGTLDEAVEILDPKTTKTGVTSIFGAQIEAFLDRASDALRRLARTTEATVADVIAARRAHNDAIAAVEPARQLFDLLVAARLGEFKVPVTADEEQIAADTGLPRAREIAEEMRTLHFPVAFPEVFLRDRPGFDCILGNPPWEEATVEELGFFALRNPGMKSLAQAEQKKELARLRKARPDLVAEYTEAVARAEEVRRVLLAGPYPGMGKGDPDLYKAFSWRFWQLARDGGAIGVVLPRSALMVAGSAPWRLAVLDGGAFDDVTVFTNTGGWVFDDAEHRYTIGLVTIRKGTGHAGLVRVRGPYSSLGAFVAARTDKPAEFSADEFREWSEGASFPLLPSAGAAGVFLKLRAFPRLDSLSLSLSLGTSGHGAARDGRQEAHGLRPMREFDATTDREHFSAPHEEAAGGLWPVYKGASFNLWQPDTGNYYGWADPARVTAELHTRRLRQHRHARSAFSEFPSAWIDDEATLPCLHPRIAFRDIARATDSRTVIACLVPRRVVLTNTAPYLLWPHGDERDQAYLLGVLCSIPLDWYARRVVETHVNFHIFNSFPMPRLGRDDPIRLRVEQIAGRLAAVDERYADWAAAVGVGVGSVTDAEKPDLIAELDAAVAHLYGLRADDVKVIFETFHVGLDCSERLAMVLDHFEELA